MREQDDRAGSGGGRGEMTPDLSRMRTPAPPFGSALTPGRPGAASPPTPPWLRGAGTPPPPLSPPHRSPLARRIAALKRLFTHRSAAAGPAPSTSPRPTPDGRPAKLPPAVAGSGGSGGKAVQRFSGSGVAGHAQVERQERRARRMTLGIAALAALLIASSAFVLFDPRVLHSGFGFAVGQRLTRVDSGVPLLIDGTEPPTPGDTQPTPTPNATNAPQPTPTPQATSTPQPTATPRPTPVPTVIPTGAVVHLTPATQPASWSGPLSVCPSGCDLGDTPLSTSNGYTSSASSSFVMQWDRVQLTLTETTFPKRLGWTDTISANHLSDGNWPCINFSQTGDTAGTPTLTFAPGATKTFNCMVPATSPVANGSITGDSLCGVRTPHFNCNSDPNLCDPTDPCTFVSWTNTADLSHWGHWTEPGSACTSVINQSSQQAGANGPGWGQSWLNTWLSQHGGDTAVWGPQMRYVPPGNCSPPGGTNNCCRFTFSATTTAFATALAYKPGDAQPLSLARLTATLPAHTVLRPGATPCTAPQPAGVSAGSSSFSVQCTASGTAVWDWAGDTALQDELRTSIHGQTQAQAEAICNSDPRVVRGSCHITFVGGNVNIVPDTFSEIQIVIP